MIINSASTTVVTNNTQGQSFSIQASAKAFDILCKGIYTNVQEAIVRELISNGHDAHIRANKLETPIQVHCPNETECTFEVRDFGVSMTEEEVTNIYTTFFSSTKSNTNDQVGSFGLGAKTPLAYTDTFTLVTYLNCKETTYVICKSNGIPTLNKMDTIETKEPNGCKVIVPVEEKDISNFETNLKFYKKYSCFNFECNVSDVEPLETLYTYDIPNVVRFNDKYHSDTFVVRMGGVPYLINYYKVESFFKNYYKLDAYNTLEENCSSLQDFASFIDNTCKEFDIQDRSVLKDFTILRLRNIKPVLIDINIGDATPTASRDTLQVDKTLADIVFKNLINTYSKAVAFNDKSLTELKANPITLQEFAEKVEYFENNNLFPLFASRQTSTSIKVKLSQVAMDINFNRDWSVPVLSERLLKDNNVLEGFDFITFRSPVHTIFKKCWQHSAYYSSYNYHKGDDKSFNFKIALVNNSPNYAVYTDERGYKETYKYILTMPKKYNIEEVGKTIQERLDTIWKGHYEVVIIDVKEEKTSKVSSSKLTLTDRFGDKPLVKMAVNFYEKIKPLTDKLGYFPLNFDRRFLNYLRTLNILSKFDSCNIEAFTEEESNSIYAYEDLRNLHKGAVKQLEKIFLANKVSVFNIDNDTLKTAIQEYIPLLSEIDKAISLNYSSSISSSSMKSFLIKDAELLKYLDMVDKNPDILKLTDDCRPSRWECYFRVDNLYDEIDLLKKKYKEELKKNAVKANLTELIKLGYGDYDMQRFIRDLLYSNPDMLKGYSIDILYLLKFFCDNGSYVDHVVRKVLEEKLAV